MSNGTSTVSDILKGMAQTNQIVNLVLAGTNLIVPLVKGAVQEFRKLRENADGTVEYSIVLKSGQDELSKAAQDFQDGLDLVNSELTRMGLPTL